MKFSSADESMDLAIDHVYVAGWTGRNREAVEHHIQELALIGIAPPSQVPLYYRVSNALLTQSPQIEVLGTGTSGEVEPLLIQNAGKLWIGLASDHTDRELEAHSVAASKQACLKPAASELWEFNAIADHIDSLILRCTIKENGQWITYQEGTLASISPLSELITASGFGDKDAMLCGTLAAIGGVRAAREYRMELEDPIMKKSILLNYSVTELPIVL